jgi:hypothetical protein
MATCLHFSIFHGSMSMSACFHVSISMSPFLHFSTFPDFHRQKIELMENGHFRLFSANGKRNWQASIFFCCKRERKNGRLFYLVGNNRRLLFLQTCSFIVKSVTLATVQLCLELRLPHRKPERPVLYIQPIGLYAYERGIVQN